MAKKNRKLAAFPLGGAVWPGLRAVGGYPLIRVGTPCILFLPFQTFGDWLCAWWLLSAYQDR